MDAGMIVAWIACAIAAGIVAYNKGRSVGGWSLLGAILGPIGVLMALVVAKNEHAIEARSIASGEIRRCPHCAEMVKAQATICKHCHEELEPLPAPAPKAVKPPLKQPADDLERMAQRAPSSTYF